MTLDPNSGVAQPDQNRIIFLGGSKGRVPHLFRSQDAGQTWSRVESMASGGTAIPFVPEGDITAIELSRYPSNSSVVYVGTSLGAVYRTTNGGAAPADWQRIDNDLPFGEQISAISVHPTLPDRVWVTVAGEGVTFTARPDVVVNPLGSSHVFKGIFDGTAWTWSDASGTEWLPWSLPDVPTSAVVVDLSTWFEVAYVGTGCRRLLDLEWRHHVDPARAGPASCPGHPTAPPPYGPLALRGDDGTGRVSPPRQLAAARAHGHDLVRRVRAVIGFLGTRSYPLAAALVLVYALLIWLDSSSLTAGAAGSADPSRRGATLALHSMAGYAGGFVGPPHDRLDPRPRRRHVPEGLGLAFLHRRGGRAARPARLHGAPAARSRRGPQPRRPPVSSDSDAMASRGSAKLQLGCRKGPAATATAVRLSKTGPTVPHARAPSVLGAAKRGLAG